MIRSIADVHNINVSFEDGAPTFPNRENQRDAVSKSLRSLDLATMAYASLVGNADPVASVDPRHREKIRTMIRQGKFGSYHAPATPASGTQTRIGQGVSPSAPVYIAPDMGAINTIIDAGGVSQSAINLSSKVSQIREEYNNWMTRNVYRQRVMPAGTTAESRLGVSALMARQNLQR